MKIQNFRKANWLNDLSGAWIFYTILPKWPLIEPKFNHIVRFAPFIGFFIGSIQGIIWVLLSKNQWPLISSVSITLIINILLSGGIHIDGLIDTLDGIGAGKERCFEAMKDSRIGAIGVQSLLFVILLQIAALIKINNLAPLALPISAFWGRFSQIWAVGTFNYINQSSNSFFHKKSWQGNKKEMTPSIILILLIIISVFFIPISTIDNNRILLIIGIAMCSLPAILIPYIINKKIGGQTGDTYGASLVLVETISLLIMAIFWNAK